MRKSTRKFIPCLMAIITGAAIGTLSVFAQNSNGGPANILLITPDQMSAEFMHTFGYPYPDTPNLDRLAATGTVFRHAYSAGPWTTPSMAAIHTGLYPTVHGLVLPPYQGCGESITHPMISGKLPSVPPQVDLSPLKPTLSQMLKKAGFVTGADNANCWSSFFQVDRNWDAFQFFPGYELRDPSHPDLNDSYYLTAPKTLEFARQWLSEHRHKRFFFWVHFMEPHTPYNAPREYDQFSSPDDFPDLFGDNASDSLKLEALAKIGRVRAIRRLRQLYAAKILFTDDYIGRLFATLKELGLDHNTLIILVSDHGELLYTHPEDFNTGTHRSLYDADVHVPLMMWGPGVPRGKRLDAMAVHYDLVPTILDMLHLPKPQHLDGKSLVPLLTGEVIEVHKYVYCQELNLKPQYSVRDQRYKLIETLRTGDLQCFDTLLDPAEKRDICGEVPQKAAELKFALDTHIQEMIAEAKSYKDWENNAALAVIEAHDSKTLELLAPNEAMIVPGEPAHFQMTGTKWTLAEGLERECHGPCFLAPAGLGQNYIVWRHDLPFIGDYDIYINFGHPAKLSLQLATEASLKVYYRGGSLSFPLDLRSKADKWELLGRFHDPLEVKLTNLANGAILGGSVLFRKVAD